MAKRHWIAGAFLSSALLVGCGGTNEQAPEVAAETGSPASPVATEEDARPAAPAVPPKVKAEPAARKPAPERPRFREVSAPAGTDLHLELTTALSTQTAQVETPVTARLRRSVIVDGVTVLPAGATFHGNVTGVERAGRVKGRSHLALQFTEVTVNGERDNVRTNEVSFEGEATKGEDATKIGAGAGIGAAIGGILGGGEGAAKGAAIGGAAGTGAVLATRGRDVVLPAGTDLTATLALPFQIRVEAN